ncbi:bacteriocin immunity protein [Bacillus thuringiensis]|uniref:bacteriocin immunity protein n=1 Tax=Bacillus thuringiensis TaxID=1428 RepID=UPI001C46F5B0|nr:bacteriocin immunity protein [Bacillus thuringiensis]MBV6681459.1 bacteriocin immunity protein [Bacillus thuringiensis]
MTCKMTKTDLLELVKKNYDLDLPEDEHSNYVHQFNNSGVPHPAPSDLIFWNDEESTPEEVVEIAWNYKEEKNRIRWLLYGACFIL